MITRDKLIPEGDYLGHVLTGWYLNPTAKGMMFILPSRFTEKLDEDTGEKASVQKPFNRDVCVFITKERLAQAIRDLQFLGYPHSDARGLNPLARDAFDFKGKAIGCKITHRQNPKNANWGESCWFSRKGIPQSEVATQKAMQVLDDIFKSAPPQDTSGDGFPFGQGQGDEGVV